MIFVGGIHGVGKSYFCEIVKGRLGVNVYTASEIISTSKKQLFNKDKLISDIDNNQNYLLTAVEGLNKSEEFYLLDGHLCLLNGQGAVQRISQETFISLNPSGILLLTDKPAIIAERRWLRDGINFDIMQIDCFQKEEVNYAEEISRIMDIPMFISKGSEDIEGAIGFISSIVK
jgi:adenylate kinase